MGREGGGGEEAEDRREERGEKGDEERDEKGDIEGRKRALKKRESEGEGGREG